MKTSVVFQGLNYHGAGNVGDDFMFDGFLTGIRALLPSATVMARALEASSQRLRFPGVEWNPVIRDDVSGHLWAAVGGTPFQFSSTDWSLRCLEGLVPEIERHERRTLICIGAETEVAPVAERFSKIAALFGRASTRDEHSRSILTGELGMKAGTVNSAADLANISLERVSRDFVPARRHLIGVIINTGDRLTNADADAVGAFARSLGTVAFVAGETRDWPMLEVGLWRRKFADLGPLLAPDYQRATLPELAIPFASCTTILTSRYHGALIGAWMGCRVAVIARNSKVQAVGDELGLPAIRSPLTISSIDHAVRNAREVPRKTLLALSERAMEGVRFALEAA